MKLNEKPIKRSFDGRTVFEAPNLSGLQLLRAVFKNKKISLSKLGGEVGGYSRSYMSLILSGKYIPKYQMKKKIASYFGLPIESIWKENGK